VERADALGHLSFLSLPLTGGKVNALIVLEIYMQCVGIMWFSDKKENPIALTRIEPV